LNEEFSVRFMGIAMKRALLVGCVAQARLLTIFAISAGLLMGVCLAILTSAAQGEGPGYGLRNTPLQRIAQPTEAGNDERLREGQKLTDVLGRFKMSGDRATFYVTGSNRRFIGLENLNLARIVNTIANDHAATMEWKVSGVVTEFRSSNYLLITKAVRRINSDPSRTARASAADKPDDSDKPDDAAGDER